jgi:hypothetical protein
MKSTDAKRWPVEHPVFSDNLLDRLALTGVEAHAHTAFIFNSFDNFCDLFKLAAQHISRPCLVMTHEIQSRLKNEASHRTMFSMTVITFFVALWARLSEAEIWDIDTSGVQAPTVDPGLRGRRY